MRRAWLAVLVLAAAPTVAEGQIFLASRPSPEFTIGPLFVRANVTPELHAVTVDVLWSLVIPPTKSAAAIEQDLYLLWPGPAGGKRPGSRTRSGARRTRCRSPSTTSDPARCSPSTSRSGTGSSVWPPIRRS